MKKVLVVAYHYPPDAEVGAVRPSKFARYLPEFGWAPTILTVAIPASSQYVSDKMTAEVCRVPEWPHPLKTYQRFKGWCAKQKVVVLEHETRVSISYAVAMTTGPRTRIARLKGWLTAFFCLPDREISWLVPAIWRGVRTIRKRQIGLVITTGPPQTCHLVGLALKRFTSVRWVADFRDPWSLKYKALLLRNGITDLLELWLIRQVMEQADLVLSVTDAMTEEAKK